MDAKGKSDLLRALCLISTTKAGSGHPTSCLSSVDLINILFDKFLRHDLNEKNKENDHLIFSKGHAAPLLYASFALSGGIKTQELLSLRQFDSQLEGHPTPTFKYSDFATGSLGQGLSIGAGVALYAKKNNLKTNTFVLMGDGELAEGQIYEAANFASYYKLDNLIAIADINSLGQTGKTMEGYDVEKYEAIFFSLGFVTKKIDGHNFSEIEEAYKEATSNKSGKPFVILAKTIKGKGISFLEGREDMHGKALSQEELLRALKELNQSEEVINKNLIVYVLKNPEVLNFSEKKETVGELPEYEFGEEISTRKAFGDVIRKIGEASESVYGLDGDVSNSTYLSEFKKSSKNFIECFIAEQNMASVAVGLSAMGAVPFIATFGAFLTRAFDQIRMANIGRSNIKFIGSHSGVSIGQDGPSQMGLEDMAIFTVLPKTIVLHPCDAVSTVKLTEKLLPHRGISYLRTLRGSTRVIYKNNEDFQIGSCKVLRESDDDLIVVVACGITVFEALKAYDKLLEENIKICVIDAYSIKPLDGETILVKAEKSQKKLVITIEDHYINGGLGDMVLSEIGNKASVQKMGIEKVPFSGDVESLMEKFGISAKSLINKVKEL